MDSSRFLLIAFALTAILTGPAAARAVNISNTWMLPEEGFPVFYRYFRDRISWYEADAVCQFHHANLVTADSTSQYDAIRAYLKEMDITENVWIGLSKTTEKPNFMWTDFRPLTGDGHWQQALPSGNDPLCVTMDPAADFLWKPMSCGGPEVASFICELPVPSWALGLRGCLLTELPSLTVLYIPEQLALELTSDCGLDGTKRIACKGNADREEILKQLTCAIPADDFEDKSTKLPPFQANATATPSPPPPETSSEDQSLNSKTTKPWIWTSNTIDIDYGMPTRHRRETEDTPNPSSTKSTTDLSVQEAYKKRTTAISRPDVEVTSAGPAISAKSDRSAELRATQVADLTTQDANTQPEEQAEASGGATATTAESKAAAESGGGSEDAGEYPSAINQGQLFSIIENGTMFDIIELNDTSDDPKLPKEAPLPPQVHARSTRAPPELNTTHQLFTTVVYHKEPPAESTFVTNKSVKKDTTGKNNPKKSNQFPTEKLSHKQKTPNDLETQRDDKTLTKEIEMYPIMTDPMIKLNRTNRKELPVMEEENGDNFGAPSVVDYPVDNKITGEHQHIEIKLHKEGKNATHTTLFITTKRSKKVDKIEDFNTTSNPRKAIDPKIFILNSNMTENNESELIGPTKPERIQAVATEEITTVTVGSDDPLEPEPQAQPRPNRQRQLTRPQRRSFYPYFFSRVLG